MRNLRLRGAQWRLKAVLLLGGKTDICLAQILSSLLCTDSSIWQLRSTFFFLLWKVKTLALQEFELRNLGTINIEFQLEKQETVTITTVTINCQHRTLWAAILTRLESSLSMSSSEMSQLVWAEPDRPSSPLCDADTKLNHGTSQVSPGRDSCQLTSSFTSHS